MRLERTSYPRTADRAGLTASESVAYGFQPDPLFSERCFADRRCNIRLEPEKRLMLAILEEAVYCFQDNYSAQHGKKKRLFDSAHRWFFRVIGDWVFSFENICSVLELNPEYIRKGLIQWKQKELSKPQSAPLWKGPKKTRDLAFSAQRIG
jgi:hypothetical protein